MVGLSYVAATIAVALVNLWLARRSRWQVRECENVFAYSQDSLKLMLWLCPMPMLISIVIILVSNGKDALFCIVGGMFFTIACYVGFLFVRAYKLELTESSIIISSLLSRVDVSYAQISSVVILNGVRGDVLKFKAGRRWYSANGSVMGFGDLKRMIKQRVAPSCLIRERSVMGVWE